MKSITAACITALLADAKSPFAGQHAQARSIDHGNGRHSLRMESTAAPFNKYEPFIVREGLFEERTSTLDSLSAWLFGTQQESSVQKALRLSKEQEARSHKVKTPKLGQSSPELVNLAGTMWLGPLFMGGNNYFDVVYDTGSDWVVIEGHNCSTCQGNTYDPEDSNGRSVKLATELSARHYGSASLEGFEYLDQVCITVDMCADSFEYFHIEYQEGLEEPIDGILGLSRNDRFHILPDSENVTGPLLIDYLFYQGKIDSNKFSFYFQPAGQISWMDLGEPDLSNLKQGSSLRQTRMIEEDFFWGFYNTGIAIGTVTNAFAYEASTDFPIYLEGNSLYSIIDTGSTALMISSLYFESLIYKMFDYAGIEDWQYEYGMIVTKCYYELPSLYFQIDNHWIEARPADYLANLDAKGEECFLWLIPTDQPMHILGMPVHLDYYTVHDPTTGTVSWAPHSNSAKSDIVDTPAPTEQFLTLYGNVVQTSVDPQEIFLNYAIGGLVIFAAILNWQLNMYPGMQSSMSALNVKILSGLYFLGVAFFFFYGLEPVVVELQETIQESSPTQASLRRANGVFKEKSLLGREAIAVLGLAMAFNVFRKVRNLRTKSSQQPQGLQSEA